VRSKADIGQLNLPHGTNNLKLENRKKYKKRICLEVSVNSPGNPRSPAEEGKAREGKESYACGGKDLQKRKV